MSESSSGSLSVPARCSSCSAPLESPIGCRECHSAFPSTSAVDHFLRLGLQRSYRIDLPDLESRFLAWSRELHPDYFQGRSSEEQQLSLDLSAKLNDAYATLKDPFRRAEYILGLMSGPTASEQRQMPEDFLERVLELRMEIEDAKESGGETLAALERQLLDERRVAMERVAKAFEVVAAASADSRPGMLAGIRAELNSIKYLDGLLRDLDA